ILEKDLNSAIWKLMNHLKIEESPETTTLMENEVRIKHKRQYSYSQRNNVIGLTFVEIVRNRSSSRKECKNTFRTHVINHNLNPEWKEKLHFSVKRTELDFLIKFKKNKHVIEVENIGDGMKEEEIPFTSIKFRGMLNSLGPSSTNQMISGFFTRFGKDPIKEN
ncbi:7865_t:CDS:2, partial [Cetraspora pellucida]